MFKWFYKKQIDEIIKAVAEKLRELSLYLNNCKDTSRTSRDRPYNHFPTAEEIQKQMDSMKKQKEKAHDILKGNK